MNILSKPNRTDLICLSHLRWNFVFQRPQHLMSRFAKVRRVFFVEEPVIHHEKAVIHEPEPAMIAPSAFAWGNDDHSAETQVADDDRRPGESWVERAYRGPSPGNPSVSLRARLKRAAFFDKREREVAAGTAEPVDTDAGLPEAMVEEQERELA